MPVPTAGQMLSRIREMVEQGKMQWDEPHFRQRLVERQLSMRQILETAKKGTPVGSPRLDEWGDWRLKLKRKVAGRRVQVVVAMKSDHFVFVTAI